MDAKAAVTVHFPVKLHVYKYLQSKVGEKLVLTKNNFFGSTVIDIFKRTYSVYESVSNEYTFPVEVSTRYMEKNGIFLDDKSLRKFNSRFDDMFREEMRSYVYMSSESNGLKKESALRQFLFHYNISEDDIKFETLVKDLQRNL